MSSDGKRVRRSPEDIQHQAEHARPRRSPSVLGYLLILFAVAFLLLLMAYFQQRRASAETNSALKESVSAVEAIQRMMEENETLRGQTEALQQQIDDLGDQADSLNSERLTLSSQLQTAQDRLAAMDYLWRIQRFYSRGAFDDARALTDDFRATGLPAALPQTNPSGVDGVSPMEQYNALLDAMGYREEP